MGQKQRLELDLTVRGVYARTHRSGRPSPPESMLSANLLGAKQRAQGGDWHYEKTT